MSIRGQAKVDSAIGKTITNVVIVDDTLTINFADGTSLVIRDEGQTCCESRYMTCDDPLDFFRGSNLQSIEVRDAPDIETDYGVYEQQFLLVATSSGVFTIANHNEHNGYYGGFDLEVL